MAQGDSLVACREHPWVSPDLAVPGQRRWWAGGELPVAPRPWFRAWFLSLLDGHQLC